MKSLLIVYSYHHNNTQKAAQAIAKVLEADIKTPEQTNPQEPSNYDLVGFGAGIDSGKHYRVLLDFADKLQKVDNKDAFIFSTAGVTGKKKLIKDQSSLREKLEAKGYRIVDEFQCKGFNTMRRRLSFKTSFQSRQNTLPHLASCFTGKGKRKNLLWCIHMSEQF